MNGEFLYKFGATLIGGIVGFLGGLDTMLIALIWLAIIDYGTGCTAAAMTGGLKSKIGYKGIIKKVVMFIIVGTAHIIDGVLGSNFMIREMCIFFYISNELLSILENAIKLNLPIPTAITNAVDIIKTKSEEK